LACSRKDDPLVEILEVQSGRKVMTLACSNGVSVLAWSPDGKRLAAGCLDFHIDVWNAETGRRQARLEGFQRIISLSFSHAGNLLASSGWDGMSRLWNLDTGRQIASYVGGGGDLQFSPDDKYLRLWQRGSAYGWLEVAYSRECLRLYVQPDGGWVSGPEFSADGRFVAAGSNTKVRFWDTSSGNEIASFREKKLGSEADTLIFHPDGRSLIDVDGEGISMRSIEHLGGKASSSYRMGKPVRYFEAKGLDEAALSLDARHLAVAQEFDNQASIFDLQKPSARVVLSGHPVVGRIAISPDGRWVATAAWLNPLVKIWDARSGELVRTMSLPARAWVTFSPDGRWLAISGADYQLLEVGSWQPKNPPNPGLDDPAPNFTAFSPDGRVMARTDGHKIQLLETLTEKPLATLEAPGLGVAKFKFSPDGGMLAVTQNDQQVQLWDLRLVRQELKQMHLDWDMPPYPPASTTNDAGPVTLEIESDADNLPPAQSETNAALH
jgi:WD40 repeat protein